MQTTWISQLGPLLGAALVITAGVVTGQTVQPRIIVEGSDAVPRVDISDDRPTFGIRVAAVTEAARREFGLTTRRGALVVDVPVGSAFDGAEIGVGSAVVAVDGRRIDSPQDLIEFVRAARVGQVVELTYYEGEQLLRKRVRVGSSNPLPAAVEPGAEELSLEEPRSRPGALKRLERALEGIGRPLSELPGDVTERDAELVLEVEQLRLEVRELRRRLADLELRLTALEPRRPADGHPVAGRADDDRPGLDEPAVRTPPKPPEPRP